MAMRSHAVVVGASMAGLLAARSLLDHYERVTIVDRDDIPSRPQPRGGVPQGRHAHGLLAEGRTILEEMFPGLTSDLTARGARLGDVGLEGVWCFTPRPLARRESGLTALLVSRSLLEWYVRERVTASPAVTLREDASVLDLAFSGDDTRVVGVIVQDRDGGTPALLPADLVVDATGRGSRTPEWLERRGYQAPAEEVRRVDKRYTTYRVREAADGSTAWALAVAAQPGLHRGGIMLAEEGGSRVVSLVGRFGERPPVALARVPGLGRHPLLVTAGRRAGRAGAAGRGRDLPLPGQPAPALRGPDEVPRGAGRGRGRAVRVRPGLRPGDDRRRHRGGRARPVPPARGSRARRPLPPGGGRDHRHAVDHRGRWRAGRRGPGAVAEPAGRGVPRPAAGRGQ